MAVDIAYARKGDTSIAYTIVGDGPVDLVFGAGLMSHIDLLFGDPNAYAWLRRLARVGRLIVFDKPGTGLSDPIAGTPTLDDRADDFRAVLDAAGSRRAILIGFSEAGPPAAIAAGRHPDLVEGLVLLSTLAMAQSTPDYLPQLHDRIENHMWRWLWHGAEHWGDGQLLQQISPWFLRTPLYRRLAPSVERACASPGMARRIITSLRGYDARAAMEAVRCPTLVTHRLDEWVPAETGRDLVERIPGATLRELPGEEHLCFFDGDDFVDAIEDFVGGRAAPVQRSARTLTTVLYTDIVQSTASVASAGDERWRSVLESHDGAVADAVARAGGRLVKTMGDGALAVFDVPAAAVRCAESIRTRLADLGLEVRAGVHTGEVETIGDDVAGIAAHIGARILGHAGPGEILVSGTVRDLTLGSGLRLALHDEVELRDVPGRWQLLAVVDEEGAVPRPEHPAERLSVAAPTMTGLDRAILAATQRAPGATRAVLRVAGSLRRRSDVSGR